MGKAAHFQFLNRLQRLSKPLHETFNEGCLTAEHRRDIERLINLQKSIMRKYERRIKR